MKFIQALALVAFSAASVGAKSFLGPVDNEIRMFTTHTVEWLTDREERRSLALVKKTGYGWEKVKTIFDNEISGPPGGNFSWAVYNLGSEENEYGLWLFSEPTHPEEGDSSYADLRGWFKLVWPSGVSKQDLKT